MPNDIELPGNGPAPRISDATVEYQKSLLGDPAFVRDYPQQAAMIRATLDDAIAATGWQPPPADPRTPAQKLHDARHGLSFDAAGNAQLPDPLVTALTREAKASAPDGEKVAAELSRAGLDPVATMENAALALAKASQQISPQQLSAWSLAQLSLYGARLREHAKTLSQS
jgi:hypothetical protein